MHTFEQSGLGKAPFSAVNEVEAKDHVEGVFYCEHCGTVIKNRYFVKSADGRFSVVGVDCLKKTGDAGLLAGVKRIRLAALSEAREAARVAALAEREALEVQQYGKTLHQLESERLEQINALKSSLLAQAREFVSTNPLLIHLSSSGHDFNAAVISHVLSLEPMSAGMIRVLRDIETKRLSDGARKGSKRFISSYSQAEANVRDVVDFVKQRIQELDDEHKKGPNFS